jgi:hypothetical protein
MEHLGDIYGMFGGQWRDISFWGEASEWGRLRLTNIQRVEKLEIVDAKRMRWLVIVPKVWRS